MFLLFRFNTPTPQPNTLPLDAASEQLAACARSAGRAGHRSFELPIRGDGVVSKLWMDGFCRVDSHLQLL